ncbi:F-box/WD repeat-containing protein 12 isoform X2 [Pristis pectinata]|uniref:F-box/WD repeat-containing protein 12 isoform X2 n=1 Tax=Pristis pectinata TaxID=685728 RepID=UPI00223D553D|nr:F-box/WD repeat-containing protein 12 isoform X2 [Pristis pectinata]XP_051874875.1 F-box/WD repeat-containing protein 12 isoform X2 [Pristis pectinata]
MYRRLCLERWIFCNLSKVDDGINSWKRYYLHRSKLEQHMASGCSTTDYTCTTFRGHSGRITGLQYWSNPDNQFDASKIWRSVVCTTSTDCTLRAWSIREGKQLWSTSVQEEPLVKLLTLPQQGLVITADSKGNIKLWNGQTGEELAVFATSCTVCNLVTYNIANQHCLTVGTGGGALITLTVLNLSQISRLSLVDGKPVDFLLVSPDHQWIIGGTKSNDVSAKVLRTECLMDHFDDDRLATDSLQIHNCYTACWLPKAPSRLVTMTNANAMVFQKSIITLDIIRQKRKHQLEIQGEQVGNFTYEEAGWNDALLEGHGMNTVIIAHQTEMKLFSIDGVHLASFHDHKGTISGISVDPFRVVTASMDLSLRVYTWKRQPNKCLSLESNYHLLGGSHMRSRGFTSVVCDYVSIVGAVETNDGKDVLKAYNFNV